MESINEKITIPDDDDVTKELNNEKENTIVNDVTLNDLKDIEEKINSENPVDIDIASFYKLNYTFRYPSIFLNKDTSDDENLLKCDQMYREDLILLFNLGFALSISKDLGAVLSSCTKCIDFMFKKYKDYKQIIEIIECLKKTIVMPFELDDNTAFLYLFSIDYLYLFHNCVKDIYKNDIISETNFNILIEKIKEN